MTLPGKKIAGAILCLCAVIAAAAAAWCWLLPRQPATDNAYIRGDVTVLAAKVGGYVVSVAVQDNEAVEAGQILFSIDDRDHRARLTQAEANVSAALARLANVGREAQLQHSLIRQVEAQRRAVGAELELAGKTDARRRVLAEQGFVSRAQLDESAAGRERAQAGLLASSATVEAQRERLGVLATQRDAAVAAVMQAEAARDIARIDLENTIVRAPIAGVVGNRQVRVGRLVAPGAPMLEIVPVDALFVIANFKETQLKGIRQGQVARVRIDSYPKVEIEAVVDSFAPGSGSSFSLIPPDSATGNFVRVVQRVPVKLRLRHNPLAGRLVPGMSARVRIDTGDGP